MSKQFFSIGVMPVICALLMVVASQSSASAQRLSNGFSQPYTPPSTSFRPGGYVQTGNNSFYNPTTQSNYVPGQGVLKSSGLYRPAGNGYYRNDQTGNIYNPTTGSYTTGKNLSFKPGNYHQTGNGSYYNPTTGSTYLKGQAVIKNSGVYTPIGNGYYRNPQTGNVYNPSTGAYKSR